MAVKREYLGEALTGAPIYAYHLINDSDMEVVVLNYGCNIKNIFVPDKDGNRVDVSLGYDDYKEYFQNGSCIGSTIGPSANRIANAKYTIDGKEYILPINDGPNNLHTDKQNGFHKRVWDASEGENFVKFRLESEDGDMGFAGNRVFELTFTLTDDNALELCYHATSDANTLINMTNHSYFNLSGEGTGKCENHFMKMNASCYTPVIDSASIPTGEIAAVAGTPFDFTNGKEIGADINEDNEQLKFVGGYDHNFVIDDADGSSKLFCTVSSPVTGITMECFTTLPGFQFYTANFLGTKVGKNGHGYGAREAFCLETQFYPNSINDPGFPDCVFGPERNYDSVTIYKFSK